MRPFLPFKVPVVFHMAAQFGLGTMSITVTANTLTELLLPISQGSVAPLTTFLANGFAAKFALGDVRHDLVTIHNQCSSAQELDSYITQ